MMSFIDVDNVLERAQLSDLHKIVLGIRHIDLREFLRLRSSPLDVVDFAQYTPLAYAAAKGNTDSVRALLEAGADPEYPLSNQNVRPRPLHVACQHGNLDIVRILVEAGEY